MLSKCVYDLQRVKYYPLVLSGSIKLIYAYSYIPDSKFINRGSPNSHTESCANPCHDPHMWRVAVACVLDLPIQHETRMKELLLMHARGLSVTFYGGMCK